MPDDLHALNACRNSIVAFLNHCDALCAFADESSRYQPDGEALVDGVRDTIPRWWTAYHELKAAIPTVSPTMDNPREPILEQWTVRLARLVNDLHAVLWYTESHPFPLHKTQIKWLVKSLAERYDQTNRAAIVNAGIELQAVIDARTPSPNPSPAPSLSTPQSGVILQGRNLPALVNGKSKPLNAPQFDVIEALTKARPLGLTKDSLEKVRTDARGILTRLRRDPDWEHVIHMAGVNSGRYRID